MSAARSKRTLLLFMLALVVIAGSGLAVGGVTATPEATTDLADPITDDDAVIHECAADPPDDYAPPAAGNDVIGWVDGYWYNEPLGFELDDGLNQTELEALSARTAARFEAMRCLTAHEGVPPVTIIDRDELRNDHTGFDGDAEEASDVATFENAVFETMLLIDEETDSDDVQREQASETTEGFYDLISGEITLITDNPEAMDINEAVLAHEIGHAIQDQHFDLLGYDRETLDRDNAKLGLIEGDVHLIEHRYMEACADGYWDEPCVMDSLPEQFEDDAGDTDEEVEEEEPNLASWGLFFMEFHPYSDGPTFIEHVYETGDGWEAVNQLYEDPPQSGIEVTKPAASDEITLANLTVKDQSNEEWRRVTPTDDETEDVRPYETVGIGGITGMFADPTMNEGGLPVIYAPDDVFNVNAQGELDLYDPYEYRHPETTGWRDDKLTVYENEANETGTHWRLAFADPEDAEAFATSYQQLVSYHDGEPVSNYDGTYEFADESDFSGAVTVAQQNESVRIVTGPTLAALDAISPGILDTQAGADGDNGTEERIDKADQEPTETAPGTEGLVIVGIAVAGLLTVLVIAAMHLRRFA